MNKHALSVTLSLALSLFTPLISHMSAQDPPPPPPPPGGRPQMPAPKNLKLLQPAELMPTMNFFRNSLGVQCSFCHVRGDFASDENPKKAMARTMIVMARDINAKFPDGKTHVTCYTCHRGASEPLIAPATATPPGPPPAGPAGQ